MRQNTALRRLQRLDRNGWHEISVAKRLRSLGVGDGGKAGKQRFWSKIALRDVVF